jgi:peptidase MA superfamily protein
VAYGADTLLAKALLDGAAKTDTFPGLPRPAAHVLIEIAPDRGTFRQWVGPGAPEWGAGIAIPDENRIVLQGRGAPSSAGDPTVVLRHELAHLALHEYLGDRAPRWFDEGYACFAAGEGARDEALAANVALALRGVPTLARVDSGLTGTFGDAEASYALAYRAVADLAALDTARGLSLFFTYWRAGGSLDHAVRQAYGEPLETFESSWRVRVRRRYGGLALVSDLSLATFALLLLLAPLYVIRRRRDRARLAVLRAADEAAERRARLDAVRALLESLPPPPTAGEHTA